MRNLVVSMLAPALASILGCVDATPSDFTVPDAGSGGQPDVDYGDLPPDAITDPIEICRACLAAPEDPGPGCATGYNACMAIEQCMKIVNCYLEAGCAQKPTMAEANGCALPCFVSNGVSSLDDPIIPIATPVGACATAACHPACGGTP
jgi:hypothetical protein